MTQQIELRLLLGHKNNQISNLGKNKVVQKHIKIEETSYLYPFYPQRDKKKTKISKN